MEALGGIVPTQRRDCRKTPLCPERAGRGSSAAADLAEAQAEEKLRLREARGAPWPRLAPGLPVPLRASAAQDQPRPLPLSADSEGGGGKKKGGRAGAEGRPEESSSPRRRGGAPGEAWGSLRCPSPRSPFPRLPAGAEVRGAPGGSAERSRSGADGAGLPPTPKGGSGDGGQEPPAPSAKRQRGAVRCGAGELG